MIDYDVRYIDKEGDYQDFVITSTDVRTAMNNLFELCPDARELSGVSQNQCLTTDHAKKSC